MFKMALNINCNVVDPFHRYKMAPLILRIEGKGNGVKMVITNWSDVAKSLNRPAIYMTKFLGYELGTCTHYDQKNKVHIIKGMHDAERLRQVLDSFIVKFVLCSHCDNPETCLVTGKRQVYKSCNACGHFGSLDMSHKLCTYIMNHPLSTT